MRHQLLECVKKVETSCDQFLAQHGGEGDKTKCAKGFNIIARALRELMIEVESEHPNRGVIHAPLYVQSEKCGDECEHPHPVAVIFFNSKGEFFFQRVADNPLIAMLTGSIRPKKITISDIFEMGLTPDNLVEGIKKTMHELVMGKMATMPVAQA